ncbi:RNA polymerase II-binding domain containing protein [Parasponia andersonii]|uniref:RNA polymerase II-binding domain containing protein n=1 Tax=Parasponia andersonii TaxID=3476 RepID=A0A2P5A8N9_PARAD|nr:RNA polymerase II-binding domain containing protein [Parasponia andersonii]
MDSEKLVLLARENPRTMAFPPRDCAVISINGSGSGKAMPNELAQKSPVSVLDRFKALLKQRDDDLRVSAEDEVSLPRTEEIVQLYELVLSELSFNSKPIITDLTIVAGEQRDHAKGIADAICARILEVPVDQKLPSLYLLDSIVKNIGRDYVKYFSSRLPEVFCEAYRQVHPSQHPAMRHLFGTWSAVFPASVLHKIESQLQFSPAVNQQSSRLPPLRASESPRPTHGIHVNPKYLRQVEHSAADSHIQHADGTLALNIYAQKPAIGYEEFDLNYEDVVSSRVAAQRLSSTGSVGHTTFAFGANKLHSSSTARLARSISPSSVGSSRAIGRDDELLGKWQRRQYHNQNQLETSAAYKFSNGREHQGPRALINAYGSDSRKTTLSDRPLQIERLDANGLDRRASSMSWQHTEEEEFDWEDMSPTLADRGRTDEFSPLSISSLRSFKARPGFVGPRTTRVESDTPNSWSSQAQLPAADDSSIATEDAGPSHGFVRGLTSKISRFQDETNHSLVSNYPQEPWNMPHHLSETPQPLNSRGRCQSFQVPLPASVENRSAFVDKPPDVDTQLHGPLIGVSRLSSSTIDSFNGDARSVVAPASVGLRPSVHLHNLNPPPLHPNFPLRNQKVQFDFNNSSSTLNNQGPAKLPQLPYQNVPIAHANQQNQMQTPLQPQFLPKQEGHENFLSVPPHLVTPKLDRGYISQGHSTGLLNPVPLVQLTLPTNNIANGALQSQGGGLPPLPRGPPSTSLQTVLPSHIAGPAVSSQQPGSAFSGLLGSLMAQGLITLTKPTPVQESVGIDFNVDLLKSRHESAINALYTDLQRQCTTCGLRFKTQEEHRSHMDWHVTKNRMSKNRKQKPSRKWFVSASMWLSGAEALGTDAVPGFSLAEPVVEKKSDEEMAVPADEDQNVCALCGEPFEEFYSDETEEWMYKGAVYLNVPDGSTAGMDRSRLGSIVHAKCRSESSVVPPEGFGQDERGAIEEGNQRKRLRI